jgi:hypothetical protein
MEVHGYNADGSISISIDGVTMTVPDDMANGHRQMVARWQEAGGVIAPHIPTPTPPSPVQTPAEKLAAFLSANPDVLELVGGA